MALPIGRVCGAAGGIVSQSSLERVLQSITEHVFNLTTQLLIGLSGLAGRSLAGALSQHDDRTRTQQQQQQQNFWVEIDQIEIPNSQKELFVACFFFVKFFFLRTKIRPSVWLGERGVMCGTHLANERCYGRTDGPPPERKHNTRKLSWNENFDVHTEMGKQSSGNDAGRHFPFVSFESIQFFGEKLCAELIGPFLFKRRRRRRAVFTQAGTT